MQHDCQTVYAHPSWKDAKLGDLSAAWYQREISVPKEWAGRRITLCLEYLNSSATVFVDGKKAGEAQFPAGEVDLTAVCQPGSKHVLSLRVVARPLREVMLMFNDTNAARGGAGKVERRGLCGDVYLVGAPAAPASATSRSTPRSARARSRSARRWRICRRTRNTPCVPRSPTTAARSGSSSARRSKRGDLQDGRFELTEKWKPEKLWDLHTPQNVYEAAVSLVEGGTGLVDAALPVRFGFREFWIDGRDFYLNGTRIFLSALPLDNAQVSAVTASYEGAKESLLRLKRIGINFVYTHNYGCEPGSHLSFAEILRAADDVGMLVALSQPHFAQYDWKMPAAAAEERLRAPRPVLRPRGGEPSLRGLLRDEPQRHRLRRGHEPGHDRRHPQRPQASGPPTTSRGRWRPKRSSPGSTRAASSTTTPRATWARCTP